MSDYTGDDCYTVKPDGEHRFVVRHYPDRVTRRPCCKVQVTVNDGDRARANRELDPFAHVEALHRSYLHIERKHGRLLTSE